MEAEDTLAELPFAPGTELVYYRCQLVLTGNVEAARKALKNRVKMMREEEARQHAEREAEAQQQRQQFKKGRI